MESELQITAEQALRKVKENALEMCLIVTKLEELGEDPKSIPGMDDQRLGMIRKFNGGQITLDDLIDFNATRVAQNLITRN